ncbi:TonB-dependent receptor domain-containing protein [Kangiella sp. HZ709]|uniref:TonB-dependent receptor domain-containing protein n=1 Tax=Kangiella sp. HZ709 TaxID=2666328 RepID=UPI0012B12EDD|nr:TonB-dependent receptor [Kangiella sp. HZ709]MRX27901.1 TonB-dependent receptor [Kangiella sp. HZ709]
MKARHFKKSLTALVISGLLSQAAVAAEKNLSGTIVDDKGQPVANAEVHIRALNKKVMTNSNGQFSFDALAEGRYVIDVEAAKLGHINKSIRHDGSVITLKVEDDPNIIVVTGNPLEHSSLEMASPSVVITGDELVKNRGANIGETIAELPGVNLSSFGIGAGRPVIRGQQGNRVTVLSNNTSTSDASNASPDHWVAAEPLLAKRIEVLKGPATLIYGGEAVGGAVNVVDNRIPTEAPEGFEGGLEVRLGDSAVGEKTFVGTLATGAELEGGTLAFNLDFLDSQTDAFEIPGYAESARLRALEEAEEEEGHSEEEHEEAFGLLENSDTDTQGASFGFSWITDNGYWGVSYTDFERNYGLPGHAHGHEEEDPMGGAPEEEEEEIIRLDLEQKRWDVKGQWNDPFAGFQALKFSYTNTDYQHTELEGEEDGTVFINDSNELRVELVHSAWSGWQGAFGLQYSDSDFAAIGEEAFIPQTKTEKLGIFWLEEKDIGDWHYEVGARYDHQEIDAGIFGSREDSAFSFAAGAVWHINENWSMPINFARAQRLPQNEELLSNAGNTEDTYVEHLATLTVEVGDPNLDKETANNFDIGLRYNSDNLSGSIAIFNNRVNNFIFLEHIEEDHAGEEEHDHEELPLLMYAQQDVIFEGLEAEVLWTFAEGDYGYWQLGAFGDYTHAEFNNASGAYIPRQPARRLGVSLGYEFGDFSAELKSVNVAKQDKVAEEELQTDGYDLLNLTLGYGLTFESSEGLLFLRAQNLLDEEIRDHASFLKDRAPRPGRSVTAGFRLTF